MKTKLVYVLTCAPEATYIEQALMSVYSARYYNPDAHIALMVDDQTDALLIGKRGEILNYISEKIVLPFEDETLTPMYRSRWIKTKVRELIKGDFLFVDCDTICCKNICEVDGFDCEIGAVPDNNTLFQQDRYKEKTLKIVSPICDLSHEEYYFSSGVLYCKDTPNAHELCSLWHQYWEEGVKKGINIDQPALAKANLDMKHIIQPLNDVYNCVLYTQNQYLYNAVILHIANSAYMSFLFKPKCLSQIREQGLTTWFADFILRVHATYLPFDYAIKYSSLSQRLIWIRNIAYAAKMYGRYVDNVYQEWEMRVGIERLIKRIWKLHGYRIGAIVWLLYKRMQLIHRHNIYANVCAVEEGKKE